MRALDDLRWLLFAPPLLNPEHPRFSNLITQFSALELEQIDLWLVQLSADPTMLVQWMQTKPPLHLVRLGRYAEHLIEFFLLNGPCFNLAAANIPLRYPAQTQAQGKRDHTTQGELDFLLYDQAKQPWHWELAVKYFLCLDVPDPQPQHMIGPDAVETFDAKLSKLFDRQLKHLAPPPYDQVAWQARALTRGWIFYPWASRDMLAPSWLHPKHPRGVWIHFDDLTLLPDGDYVVLNRQQWLAHALRDEAVARRSILNKTGVAQVVAQRWESAIAMGHTPSGVLICAIDALHEAEVFRCFVVPNLWPHPMVLEPIID
jgi:uncharacterized protein